MFLGDKVLDNQAAVGEERVDCDQVSKCARSWAQVKYQSSHKERLLVCVPAEVAWVILSP